MKKRPNILFFFTDDQRFDTIAALGNNEIKTPNLDALVSEGAVFTQAHIPGGTHGAVCMPSRAMLHTGRTLFHITDHGSCVLDEHALLGETLKDAGYRTFGTGKWHNGPHAYARSFTDGDDIFFWGMWDHWNVPVYDFDPIGKYEKTSPRILNPMYENSIVVHNCNHMHLGKHSTELFCESAASWLEKYDSTSPFFMYVSLMSPHDPRSMPEEFLKMYNPEEISLPLNFMEEHPFDFGIKEIRDELLTPYPREPGEIKRHLAEYYAMISHLDHEFGKLISVLKKTGVYEDTIIVFSGDNGLGIGRHGLMGKQNNYEHSIRVPLIFAGPGIPKNVRYDSYVYLLDIFPTLCDLTGTNIPKTVEGMSLAPVIQGKETKVRDTLYFAYEDLIRSVKNNRYKLIEYRTKNLVKTQLFDLLMDTEEINDLYGKEGYDEITSGLREELLKFKREWDDEGHITGKAYWGRHDSCNC